MDKGARYFRCDFQVHSPRDNQWVGERPVSDEERKSYSKKFVAACRQKGLDAVAITDHHDLCFFPYIQAAAAEEVDHDGAPVPNHMRLIVFPGMELTLADPCQAIVIFDAELPLEQLEDIYPLLGWKRTDYAEVGHRHAETLRFQNFGELHEILDSSTNFRGRYILLPNVTEKGHQTLMRQHFALKYREMTCVGGYVDKPVSSFSPGFMQKLDGQNLEFGNKPLGIFQTSDNRCGSFSKLGNNSSWVKWSTPTAEALRQACLARETRITHVNPVIPSMVITRLEVSDSRFLGEIDLHLNPQYSCLIGGRGTGKSTILEYIRWALCDQPPGYTDEDDAATYQEKRAALIEKTLVPHEGVVTVSFMRDSVPHVVRRSPKTKEVSLKIGSDGFTSCTEADIRDLLPLQAYSQKQLSAVGIRTDELVRFIRTPIKAELDRIGAAIEQQRAHTKGVFLELIHKRKMVREQEKEHLELASLTQRISALRQELKGVSDEDQKTLAVHDLFLQEELVVERLERDLERLRVMATDFLQSLDGIPSGNNTTSEMPNAGLVTKLRESLAFVVATAKSSIEAVEALLGAPSGGLAQYTELLNQWKAKFDSHTAKYVRAKQEASSNQSQLTLIDDAETKLKALRTSVAQRHSAIELFGDPEAGFRAARLEWVGLCRQLSDILEFKCSELTTLSAGRIKATLRRGAGVQKIKDRLRGLVVGTKVRSKKAEDLCDAVAMSADPLREWSDVMDELEQLVDYSGGEADEPKPKETPLLTKAGFSTSDLQKLSHKVTPDEWLQLSLLEIDDVPAFEYRQNQGLYIEFAEASAGQQATALLQVLLNQEGPPLIIDQPEEDLDNQIVLDIVKDIWRAKKNRQIIFSSHNPNIVVNGDADLVVCCDYRTAGDHSGGKIKFCGAIDGEDIRKEITVVMEGGLEAFRLRKEKYGF